MPGRLTYLYVRHKDYPLWKLQTDGHYTLMRRLAKYGFFDHVRIVRESYGIRQSRVEVDEPGFSVVAVPNISEVHLAPDEVVWVRGGWKPWNPWIESHMDSHWIIYYGANTGHHPWRYWDVVLSDLTDRPARIADGGKLYWPYRKPVSPEFVPMALPVDWDVCVGASHIYDRKGQFRILEVIDEYRRLTGRLLQCVMPGSFYSRERKTEAMRARLETGEYPNISLTGMLSREELVKVYNRSRFLYAATCGGQGDRCALEAGACGCRLVVGLPKNHAPYLYSVDRYAYVPPHQDDTRAVARYLAQADPDRPTRAEVAAYHRLCGGMDTVLERLDPLVGVLTTFSKKSYGRGALLRLVDQESLIDG